MPRRARYCPASLPVHIIQRGNNRQAIFTCDDDLAAYAHWLAEGARRFDIAIHGWAFMTNHVHLLATPAHDGNTSRLMQYLGRCYVRHFNYAYTRSGTLFEGRFKTSIVQEDSYFLTCLRYIELNPVRPAWSRIRAIFIGQAIAPMPLEFKLACGHHTADTWAWLALQRFAKEPGGNRTRKP